MPIHGEPVLARHERSDEQERGAARGAVTLSFAAPAALTCSFRKLATVMGRSRNCGALFR
jgi:hypothetical protein